MSTSGRRRAAEEPEALAPAEEKARDRRRHRSAYPTPGFKAFGLLLNLLALPFAYFQLTQDSSLSVMVLALLSALGLVVGLYSNTVKPLATNLKTRTLLTTVVAAYGFLMLLALAVTLLLG